MIYYIWIFKFWIFVHVWLLGIIIENIEIWYSKFPWVIRMCQIRGFGFHLRMAYSWWRAVIDLFKVICMIPWVNSSPNCGGYQFWVKLSTSFGGVLLKFCWHRLLSSLIVFRFLLFISYVLTVRNMLPIFFILALLLWIVGVVVDFVFFLYLVILLLNGYGMC